MPRVTIHHVPRSEVLRIWPLLYNGVERALIRRNVGQQISQTPAEILIDLGSPEGEELLVIMLDGKEYVGFLTFRCFSFHSENWGTVGILAVNRPLRDIGQEGTAVLTRYMKKRGCSHLNYVVRGQGIGRICKRLGFHPRLAEWAKEIR